MAKNIDFTLGYLTGAALLAGILIIGNKLSGKICLRVPATKQVQQGYIAPRNLDFECRDLNKDGKLESIVKFKGQPYFLREVDGKPVISEYRVKPSEVMMNEEYQTYEGGNK